MQQSLIDSLKSFSIKLFSELSGDENYFISPFSVMISLAMVLTGAGTQTKKQLKSLIYLDNLTDDQILKMFYEFLSSLNYQVNISNKIYSNTSLDLKLNFCKNIDKYFLADIEKLDFNKKTFAVNKINKWVSKQTNDKIKTIIYESSLSDNTMIILLNVIYFKATWSHTFEKHLTNKHVFYSSDGTVQHVDMMWQENKFKLQVNPIGIKARLCTIPYVDHLLSMTIVLPDPESNISEIERSLNVEHLSLSKDVPLTEVCLKLPKFKMTLETQV